jgi:hypothetical protein
VDDRLRRLPVWEDAPVLRFRYRHGIADGGATGKVVYESAAGAAVHDATRDLLVVDAGGRARATAALADGTTEVEVGTAAAGDLWLLSRPLLTLPLLEHAKRRGRYGLHAGAAARNGNAVLLPGGSGSGKSTLALALGQAGLDLLADDLVFLGDELAWGLPEDVDLLPASARLLGLVPSAVRPGFPKHTVAPEDHGITCRAAPCRPAAIVFPGIGGTRISRLQELDAGAALLRLAPDILLTGPADTARHLDCLGTLVRSCPCFLLETGTDLEQAAALVGGLLG